MPSWPRVSGHEIAGRIEGLGDGVLDWKIGQRVGVGWHGGHCFHCEWCRRGDFGPHWWETFNQGWPSGTAKDSEDTLRFSVLTGVRPMIEKFPLAKVADAYERMESGKVRFRAVRTMT